jgi:hypothetical protein
MGLPLISLISVGNADALDCTRESRLDAPIADCWSSRKIEESDEYKKNPSSGGVSSKSSKSPDGNGGCYLFEGLRGIIHIHYWLIFA